jgi:hypothetical protein
MVDTETITETETISATDSIWRKTEQKKVFYYVFNGSKLEAAAVRQKYLS